MCLIKIKFAFISRKLLPFILIFKMFASLYACFLIAIRICMSGVVDQEKWNGKAVLICTVILKVCLRLCKRCSGQFLE
jgi:hypothetical protein